MGKSCFMCRKKFGIVSKYFTRKDLKNNPVDILPLGFGDKDAICIPCYEEQGIEHADEIIKYDKTQLTPEQFDNLYKTDPTHIKFMEKHLQDHPANEVPPPTSSAPSSPMGNSLPKTTVKSSLSTSSIQNSNLAEYTTPDQLRQLTKTLHDQTKSQWDKNGVVQFKDEALAILQRMWGQQVQFIVACSQLSKEGYRLMAIDEGKSGGQASGGFTGGVNAYFYFQKIDYVK